MPISISDYSIKFLPAEMQPVRILGVKPPIPRLEFLASANVKVAAPYMLGPTTLGERRIVPILSGRFEGRINAELLPGGADWQVVGPDGTNYLEARYTL